MITYHLINPAAGQGKGALIYQQYYVQDGDIVYCTTGIGDAERYVMTQCVTAKQTGEKPFFHIYGGDGTICEVVNGIMRADAGHFACFTVHPTGTGNDFVRYFQKLPVGSTCTLDVLRINGRYAVNMINIGFDCNVVAKAAALKRKPLISGSAAYILGVADVLCHKLGQRMTVLWEDQQGTAHTVTDMFLLCVAANASYCGGGFCAAPQASAEDGFLDLMLVRPLSRLRFLTLVHHYHAGTHIGADGQPIAAFRDIMQYHRCRNVHVSGIETLCRDGEVEPATGADIVLLPQTVQYQVSKIHT